VRLAGFPPQTASFERKTDAIAWAIQTEASLREGRHFASREAKRHTLAELADRYLESVARRKPHALGKQHLLLGWWKEQLGAYGLGNITPAMIAEKRDQLLAENIGSKESPRYRSPATANRYLAALSKAMSDAVREWHWLHENPVRRVTKETEPGGRIRYLSEPEKNRLLQACRKSPLRELELIVLIALTTGMRRGEIQALRWPDIDMKRAQAVIHKTKNRERRAVPLVPRVPQLLWTHHKARLVDSELVFPQVVKEAPIDPAHWFELTCPPV
jgi:integrase